MSSSSSSAATATLCPVNHPSKQSVNQAEALKTGTCPVDHLSQSNWTGFVSSESSHLKLSHNREVSSIPRTNDGHWVYPSEAQFFAAMARKNHNPNAGDMKTIVPIHNAVNERTWNEILKWEAAKGGDACGGVRLVSFKGRPSDRSPKARLNMLLGYSPPFDRHDWVVERCGRRIRYVIDFYTGRSVGHNKGEVSFFLDVRPALDSWEGVKMRAEGVWNSLFS